MTPIIYKRPKWAASKLRVTLAEFMEHTGRGEIRCSICKKWKPAETDYHRNKGTTTGYRGECRECLGFTGELRYQKGRGFSRCGYCNRGGAREEIRLAGVVYQVHASCATRAREYVYGEPVRDPVGAE